jgi:DNA repair photolyase
MRRTIIGRQLLTGRGALSNPPGRFDKRHLEQVDDGWYMEESPQSINTTLEAEACREIITRNDSPDIPFEQSINPYRGCEHACIYCMAGDTPVLMADGSTRALADVKSGDVIYGTQRTGHYRRYVRTQVLAHWSVIKPAFRISLADGTSLTAGADHRFLTERGWKFVQPSAHQGRRPHLSLNDRLVGTGAFARGIVQDEDYRRGYLCGMIRADAHPGTHDSIRNGMRVGQARPFRLALCDPEALTRCGQYLAQSQVGTRESVFQAASGSGRALHGIRTSARAGVYSIRELIAWPAEPTHAWSAGYLAGIFDAQGSCSGPVLRIRNFDPAIIAEVLAALRIFGFPHVVQAQRLFEAGRPIIMLRLTGGLPAVLRFLHTVLPAALRRLDLTGKALNSTAALKVVGIEPLPGRRLYDITTGTGDFIANGVVSHNCYARPSHAYMGLSPGLDFETRLFYKADAARALETQLARPGYVVKPITLGANTDPYQPVERRMRVTRSILEVLTRTRHPVTIITKSALVLRDLDLLAQLASQRLISVAVSITTLDNELKRVMEPRTASPQARLRTLQALHEAKVPCGVLVAPVIPALTDQDLEAILGAAAQAGAGWAGYVLLRLPYEIKDLFREWLAEHFPQRANHIMSLIREMRGGRENDPNFGSRMRGTGPYAQLLRERFRIACRRFELMTRSGDALNTAMFTAPVPEGPQLRLGL